MSTYKFPTVVNLFSVKVRLTAYSLWQDNREMTDWNLEGSNDGEERTVLHETRIAFQRPVTHCSTSGRQT